MMVVTSRQSSEKVGNPSHSTEQPQFQLLTDPNTRFKDGIEIGGLLLCKTPAEFVDQRRNYYAQQTSAQTEAVDNNLMRQSDPRMPNLQRAEVFD
jgi:hypothetical protein